MGEWGDMAGGPRECGIPVDLEVPRGCPRGHVGNPKGILGDMGVGRRDDSEMLAGSEAFIALARPLGSSKVFLAPGFGLGGPRKVLFCPKAPPEPEGRSQADPDHTGALSTSPGSALESPGSAQPLPPPTTETLGTQRHRSWSGTRDGGTESTGRKGSGPGTRETGDAGGPVEEVI